MLSINNLDIRFGEKHLFKNVSVQIFKGNRIGLVGVNGAGKSTLLKIMAGVDGCDDGVLTISRHFTVGYLAQESAELFSDRTLYQEAETAFASLLSLQQELDTITEEMSRIDSESQEFAEMVERHGDIMQRLEGSDIYTIDGKIERILTGLGFSREDMVKPVSSFSGGWQMRLKLAKILLEEPSLLLLDEPTNHLDLNSLTWVENFLKNYSGSLLVISHDRAFLDKVTENTWELSFGKIDIYKGNYSYYIKERAERRAITQGAYANQQAQIRQTMRFVERFRSKATKARQVQSRVKQLEKMELIELAEEEKQIRFRFPEAPASGRDVLKIEGLQKSFGRQTVFSKVDLLLSRGDKIAVVGVNGAGKSTLLKIIAGQIEKGCGDVIFGSNVTMSYFGQHQAQELSSQLSVLETMALSGEELTLTQQRSLLGAFLFRGQDVEKKVAVLSGGEKSRLALAKMIAVPANLMLLDEPTNHLDMSSQDVLQEAMQQYAGTIMVVSHNRYFVDGFVNKVLEVRDGQIIIYEGNVADYLRKQEELQLGKEAVNASLLSSKENVATHKEDRKVRRQEEAKRRQKRNKLVGKWLKQSKEAEKKIELLEAEKELLETKMTDSELYNDQAKWSKVSSNYDECKRRLDRNYTRWEEAQEEIERIDAELDKI